MEIELFSTWKGGVGFLRDEKCSLRNLQEWLDGLGVWFALWVREVPGSNPGQALSFASEARFQHKDAFTRDWDRRKFIWDSYLALLGSHFMTITISCCLF